MMVFKEEKSTVLLNPRSLLHFYSVSLNLSHILDLVLYSSSQMPFSNNQTANYLDSKSTVRAGSCCALRLQLSKIST